MTRKKNTTTTGSSNTGSCWFLYLSSFTFRQQQQQQQQRLRLRLRLRLRQCRKQLIPDLGMSLSLLLFLVVLFLSPSTSIGSASISSSSSGSSSATTMTTGTATLGNFDSNNECLEGSSHPTGTCSSSSSKNVVQQQQQQQQQSIPPVELLWYEDLLQLPANVPFPGTLWLSRLGMETKVASSLLVNNSENNNIDNDSRSRNYTMMMMETNIDSSDRTTPTASTDSATTTTIGLSRDDTITYYRTLYEAIVLGDGGTLVLRNGDLYKYNKNKSNMDDDDTKYNHNNNDNDKNTTTPTINACRNFNAYINSIFISNSMALYIVQNFTNGNIYIGHYVLCYIRNLIAAICIYYGTALVFQFFGSSSTTATATATATNNKDKNLKIKDNGSNSTTTSTATTTTSTDIRYDQIQLAQGSMFMYVMLPVLDEYLIENEYTLVYYTINEIGGIGWYIVYTIMYFAFVEIGIYWMHRTLHTNKWLYKNIHIIHHKYNKSELLTPWASIAFHPIDGILQASPYVIVMLIIPCHYITHMILLFFTAIWATYIHDARIVQNYDPIMGSKYHTIHHTHYIYNYGQVFTFCDWFWGTLYLPPSPGESKAAVAKQQ